MARAIDEVMAEIQEWTDPAEEFRKRGIKGRREDKCECPYARYLSRETGVSAEVRINFVLYHAVGMTYQLPASAVHFIWAFDSGVYPDLIEKVKK